MQKEISCKQEILFGTKSWSYNIMSLLFDVLAHLLPWLDLSPCIPSPLSFLSFIQVYKRYPVLMI